MSFVETKISLKLGEFNIRVYKDLPGKETIVLWTEKLNRKLPVIVRIHSECLTGDLFKSFHCDCGKQLTKALEIINEKGGIFIYLRQEGRGIGLFEKIKTYQLQKKGHDTFEANVVLGHKPDERTYEMVKIVLDDLKIQRIKLLTNNPSKISEIVKFGIDVTERIPLIIRANKHNRYYLQTKQNKFQHIFNNKNQHYFYQFHVEDVSHVKDIGEFLKGKIKDPLLKFYVGVSANHFTLGNKNEIFQIKSIFEKCKDYDYFTFVLHFSFKNSLNFFKELKEIKNKLFFINHLQINDLPSDNLISYIKAAANLFQIDLPLSNENFSIIHNNELRRIIKKYRIFILLDNSKGRGIKEPVNSFMKKINILLDYDINNIAVLGGFGPNELETYFKLKRYYKINFSIDAETKLKTNNRIDLEKIKLYLFQLMHFADPKQDAVKQTNTFLKKHRRSDWETAVIANKKFKIHPKVFHGGKFPSTAWYAKLLIEETKNDKNFCEVGCGSGIISCLVALTNPQINIVATDINPFAKENTEINAKLFRIENRIKIFVGDVLDSIPNNKFFDSIWWLLPFGYLDPGIKIDLEGLQVFDPGYKSIRKFFSSAKNFLAPNGKLWIGFSSDLGHPELLNEIAIECNLKLCKVNEKRLMENKLIKFEFLRGIYLKK